MNKSWGKSRRVIKGMLYQRALIVRKKQNIETVTTDHSSVKCDLTCSQKVISEFKKKKNYIIMY